MTTERDADRVDEAWADAAYSKARTHGVHNHEGGRQDDGTEPCREYVLGSCWSGVDLASGIDETFVVGPCPHCHERVALPVPALRAQGDSASTPETAVTAAALDIVRRFDRVMNQPEGVWELDDEEAVSRLRAVLERDSATTEGAVLRKAVTKFLKRWDDPLFPAASGTGAGESQ